MSADLIIGGLAVALLFVISGRGTSSATQTAPAPAAASSTPGRLTRDQVLELARQTVAGHGLRADPRMLTAMAAIESSFRPGVVGDDGHSFGLLQVSDSTGRWLAAEMGYGAHGTTLQPDPDFLRPDVSMYLGAAYVDYLAGRYPVLGRGVARDEWIVRAYNGGPGWNLPPDHPTWQTRNRAAVLANTARHWSKYRAALVELGL